MDQVSGHTGQGPWTAMLVVVINYAVRIVSE